MRHRKRSAPLFPRSSYGGAAPAVLPPAALPGRSVAVVLGRAVVDGVFADTCLACHERPAGRRLGLCLRCHGQLEPHSGLRARCAGCARPLSGARGRSGRCGACLAHPPPWAHLYTLWSYRPPFDAVVHALKFQRLESLGPELALAAFDRLADRLLRADGEGGIDVVVPVPLPWPRLLRRGFNQAEAIAAPLATLLGRPLRRALARRPSPPQSLLPLRRRAGNLRRSLRVRERLPASSVLLVDDVVTTGATLRAATAALRSAGAARVTALAVAWTPPRGWAKTLEPGSA
jgi:ComF family protein